MLESLLVGAILTCLFICWWIQRQNKFFETIPPGPMPWPIVGNLPQMVGVSDREWMTWTQNLGKQYGTPYTLSFGPYVPNAVVVDQPEHFQIILNNKSALRKPTQIYERLSGLDNGLVTLPFEIWQQHRKLLQPTFAPKILNSYIAQFVEASDLLCQRLDKHVGGPQFHCELPISIITFSTILETMCNVDTKLISEDKMKLIVQISLQEVYSISERITSVLNEFCYYNFTAAGRETRRRLKIGKVFVQELLDLDEQLNGNSSTKDMDERSFLDIVRTFNEAERVGEINTMLLAGFATVALATSYTLVLLGMNPEYQERAYKEVQSVMGDNGRSIDGEDLKQMAYVEACIKEALRLFPSIPAIARFSSAPITLDKYTLPKGTLFVCLMFSMHRRPDIYENPEVYNPDNFSTENVKKRHPYSFLPFSGGPRNCIGSRYAMLSLKVMIATMLRKYKIETDMKMSELGITRIFTLEGQHLRISLKNRTPCT